MADGTTHPDRPEQEVSGGRTTRREILKKGATGALLVVYGGALPKPSAAGVPKYRHKQLAGTLRIIQWSHFVPAYDKWFDDIYIKRWGEANDTEVLVDHINQADIPARAAAEVAAQSGHDIFFFLTPPAAVRGPGDQPREHRPGGDEEARQDEDGRAQVDVQPEDEEVLRVLRQLRPGSRQLPDRPLGRDGAQADDLGERAQGGSEAPAMGNPIGIGMSNEIDSNIALMAMMMCFGSFIQNKEQRVVLNSKATVRVLKYARELFRQGMSNEIFAWTASSNNQAMVAGRLSMAMNAISITRTAELTNPDLASKINLAPIPAGPNGRLGLEHVMGCYVIWKFAKNKTAAQKFLIDLEMKYTGAFENTTFYNFPSWPAAVRNIPRRLERDPAKPAGKYKVLGEIAEKYTLNLGWPGNTNAAIDEIINKFLIPQMFAEVAQGKRTAEDAARVYDRTFRGIFQKWRNLGKV